MIVKYRDDLAVFVVSEESVQDACRKKVNNESRNGVRVQIRYQEER